LVGSQNIFYGAVMFHIPEVARIQSGPLRSDQRYGNNGAFKIELKAAFGFKQAFAIASDNLGWEHVSVSTADRCPTWDEMCQVKAIFWDPEDCVLQFHPPKSEYVNCHPYCLHLWREIGVEVNLPPSETVGPKEGA
jgi:hypothetical protein